jgi:hypothetical protein
MRTVVVTVLLVAACGNPDLYVTIVDAIVCPDGDVCATIPDGGCDPIHWQTSCSTSDGGPPMVCDSTGMCGIECGDANDVCSSAALCDSSSDCVPPCRHTDGSIVDTPLTMCAQLGLLSPANSALPCILPCDYLLCRFESGVVCPAEFAKRMRMKRHRLPRLPQGSTN